MTGLYVYSLAFSPITYTLYIHARDTDELCQMKVCVHVTCCILTVCLTSELVTSLSIVNMFKLLCINQEKKYFTFWLLQPVRPDDVQPKTDQVHSIYPLTVG